MAEDRDPGVWQPNSLATLNGLGVSAGDPVASPFGCRAWTGRFVAWTRDSDIKGRDSEVKDHDSEASESKSLTRESHFDVKKTNSVTSESNY